MKILNWYVDNGYTDVTACDIIVSYFILITVRTWSVYILYYGGFLCRDTMVRYIIIMDFIRTHVKQVHVKETEKGKYHHYKKMIHNITETIYMKLKTKYTYPNPSSQISLIISEVLLSSSQDLNIMVHKSIPYSKILFLSFLIFSHYYFTLQRGVLHHTTTFMFLFKWKE